MSSQQPFIPPTRGGKNNGMTHGGSGESISGSITTMGSGGRGLFHEEDEKRQADDVRSMHEYLPNLLPSKLTEMNPNLASLTYLQTDLPIQT